MSAYTTASAETAESKARVDRATLAEEAARRAWEASATPVVPACGMNHPLQVYLSQLDVPGLSRFDHDYAGEAGAFFARQSPETVALAERAVAAIHARREAQAEHLEEYQAVVARERSKGTKPAKPRPIRDHVTDDEGGES